MASPVAALYATLGLDNAAYKAKLAESEEALVIAAQRMNVPIGAIEAQFKILSVSSAEVKKQFQDLMAQGLTVEQALAVLFKQSEILSTRDAELKAAYAKQEKSDIADVMAARRAAAANRTQVEELEKAAAADRAAYEKEILGQQYAAWVAEQQAEVERAQLTASTKVAILQAYLISVQAAYAEQAALDQAATLRRAGIQGAYAAGGYSVGRTAGLLGMVSPGLMAGAAGAVATYELVKWTRDAADAARATDNLAAELNLTFEQTRKLQEEAEIAGVKITSLQQASWHLAEAVDGMGAAGQRTAKRLEEIGVSGNNSGELLMSFLQVLSQIPDQTERIALAHEVMGRASYQIIPLVSNYQQLLDTVNRLGPVIGEEQRKALDETAKSLSTLNVEWERLKQTFALLIGMPIVSTLTAIGSGLANPPWIKLFLTGAGKLAGHPELASLMMELVHPTANIPGQSLNDLIAHEQGLANKDAANQYRSGRPQTLESLRSQLNQAKQAEQEADAALARIVDPLGPEERQQKKEAMDQAAADVKSLTEKIKAMERDTADNRYKLQAAELAATARHNKDLIDLELAAADEKHRVTFDEIDKEKDLRDKANLAELAETQARIRGDLSVLAVENPADRKEREVKLNSDLDHAITESAIKRIQIVKGAEEEKRRIVEENKKAEERFLKQWALEDEADQQKHEEITRELHNDGIKARMLADKGYADSATRALEIVRDNNKFLESQGLITHKERLDRERELDDNEYEIKKQALQSELDRTLEMEGRLGEQYVHGASLRQQLQNQLNALDDDHFRKQQAHNQEEAKGLDSITKAINEQVVAQRVLLNEAVGVNDRLVELENERIKTDILKISVQGLGQAYADFINMAKSDVTTLNSNIAAAIVGTKSFHDAWQATIKGAGEKMVNFILTEIEKITVAKILVNLGIIKDTPAVIATNTNTAAINASSTSMGLLDTDLVVNKEATDLNTEATDRNTEALNNLTNALNNSGSGGGGSFFGSLFGGLLRLGGTALGVPSFDSGGGVPHTMFAMVHAGETVLSSDLTYQLKQSVGSGVGGGDYYDFRGASFAPPLTQGGVDLMMKQAVGKLRRAGGRGIKSGRL